MDPRHLLTFSSLFLVSFSFAQGELVSSQFKDHYTANNMGVPAENDVDVYKLEYRTTDVDGSIDTATGALLIPDLSDCPLGTPLVSYQHGTVLKKENVPSGNGSLQFGFYFAGNAYVVSMPDYLGLGDDDGLHPYHHTETQATASLDMMRASREFMENSSSLELNGEVFLTGYSQGGHATMGLHRYIEENGLLDSFDVRLSAPLSGAYDLSGVQSELPADSSYGSPAYYPYIIASYELVYGNLYDSLEQVYDAPYDTIVPKYLTGDSTLQSFNDALPNNIYDFMKDSLLDNFYADTVNFSHPLRVALADNDLTDWAPERKVRMYYCGADEQVFPENAMVAEDSMNALGANDVIAEELSPFAGHGGCALLAADETKKIFDAERSECGSSSIAKRKKGKELRIQNLGERTRLVHTPLNGSRYQLFSMSGEKLKSGSSGSPSFRLSGEGLPSGVYILRVAAADEESSPSFQRKLHFR